MSRSRNRGEEDERTHLLGTSAPANYIHFENSDSEDEIDAEEDERYRRKSLNPTVGTGRRYSLAVPNPRIRSNSIAVYNDDEDDVVFTSYGPVVLDTPIRGRRDWLLGGFLAVLSGVLFTAGNFFVKYFTIDAIEMLMVRSVIQTFLMAVVIIITKRSFFPEKRMDKFLVIVQGVFGGAKTLFQFACVLYMPIGDALTIVFTEPLWTLILSKFILKIRIGVWKWVFGLFLLLGMILCIQPPFLFPVSPESQQNSTHNSTDQRTNFKNPMKQLIEHVQLSLHDGAPLEEGDEEEGSSSYYIGAVLAVSTAVTGAMANVVIARCEKVSSKVMVFYSGLGGCILAFVCSIFDNNNKIIFAISTISGNQWLVLVSLGLMGLVGHFSMTRSLRLIPPTTVAVLRAMEIVLAYIAQALVMGEIPNAISISGSSIVMFSVGAFALEEWILGWFKRRME